MENKLYFAYGSNINLEQMEFRCPNATVVGPCVLENYELLFRGNGGGNGVATIAPREGSEVHGLLWKITPRDERALDIYEGFPRLYDKQPVTVKTQGGAALTVLAYVMTREKERCPTMPSASYYVGILEGFQENNLPVQTLIAALKHVWQEINAMNRANPNKRRDSHER